MKHQAFNITGTTLEEYVAWCREQGLPAYRQKSKQKFFYLIRTERLCRDHLTGNLVVKRVKSK